jgi:integrase
VRAIRVKSDGFHSWTDVEISQFEERHPIGSRARLALALLLYTGQRRSDVVRMGRQHIREGALHIRQLKTGAELSMPVHPTLAAILAATPAEHLTFLTTQSGQLIVLRRKVRGRASSRTGIACSWSPRRACDMMLPVRWIGRGIGASLSNDRCVLSLL